MTLTTRILLATILLLAAAALVQTLRLSEATSRADAAALRAAAAARAGDEWEAATYTIATALTRCQAQWVEAKQRGADALAQARRDRAAARDALDGWQARWDARAADCSAALAATDAACAALEDY